MTSIVYLVGAVVLAILSFFGLRRHSKKSTYVAGSVTPENARLPLPG